MSELIKRFFKEQYKLIIPPELFKNFYLLIKLGENRHLYAVCQSKYLLIYKNYEEWDLFSCLFCSVLNYL